MTELANLSAHERNQPITFAWVGWLPDADIKIILNYFKDCAPSLYNATQEDDKGEKLRWELAPLLFLCAKWTKTRGWRVDKARLYERLTLTAFLLASTIAIFFLLAYILRR